MIELNWYRLAWPVIRQIEPEQAHRLALRTLALGLVPKGSGGEGPILEQTLWRRRFVNPVGLAAGFDKNAEVVRPLFGLGFGFVEVGTVTPRPQPGNPRPRVFRLEGERALINRLGFNNDGMQAMAARLYRLPPVPRARPVGVNVGPNRDAADPVADVEMAITALARLADYLVVNVSSPNTPGLRALQAADALPQLLTRARAARDAAAPDVALLIKVAPDLGPAAIEAIAEHVLAAGIDGIIATNTTIERPSSLKGTFAREGGGLSGPPLLARSTAVLAHLCRLTQGRLPLIGVGGIASGADAYAKIRAGASLVQLYTAFIYQGPATVHRIRRDLAALLRRDGFPNVAAAVGVDAPLIAPPGEAARPA